MVRDIDSLVKDLGAKVYKWTGEASTFYPASLKCGVRHVVLESPDHVALYHFERLTGEPWSGLRYLALNLMALPMN
jgi:hypothetical protein